MTEAEYIAAIADLWPSAGPGPGEWVLQRAREAVEAFPCSPKLWCMRGDLIQLVHRFGEETDEAVQCYQRAAELDPTCAEAFESIGYIYFVFTDLCDRAEEAFRRAIALGAGADSFAGLAKTLVESGSGREEALRLLDESTYAGTDEIRIVREEIEQGEWDPVDGELS